MSAVAPFVIVLVIYSHAYFYLWSEGILNIAPGLWYLAIFAIGIVGGVLSLGARSHSSNFSPKAHHQNQRAILVWAAVFLACAAFSFLFSEQMVIQLRALKTTVICVGMLVAFVFAFRGERQIHAARVAMLGVVLFSIFNNVIDFAGIYTFSVASGRAAGFYMNPNITGFYLVIGMVLTASLVPRRLRLYCLLVGAGVTITFSRSSMLMWFVALYGLSQLQLFSFSRRTLSVMWGALVAMVLVVQFGENMLDAMGIGDYLTDNARTRVEFNLQTDESVRGRLSVAAKSWEFIQQAPWAGHGLGAHDVWRTLVQPHNMFLLIGLEMGALGLLLYVGLLVILWRMSAGVTRVFAATFFVGSLFSHNLLGQSELWLALALVTSMAATADGARVSSRSPRAHGFASPVYRRGGQE